MACLWPLRRVEWDSICNLAQPDRHLPDIHNHEACHPVCRRISPSSRVILGLSTPKCLLVRSDRTRSCGTDSYSGKTWLRTVWCRMLWTLQRGATHNSSPMLMVYLRLQALNNTRNCCASSSNSSSTGNRTSGSGSAIEPTATSTPASIKWRSNAGATDAESLELVAVKHLSSICICLRI
ncbi:hypothetical protein BD289DRAFT_131771 [Coniella lustricola]|uniref:Uncharacterized protein n=1 Tax=Coniella lustricola TaxID=2025994 RepID=A0A2T3AFS1_9PEZI|nr:hypothetical protein BD289DRAFT_131771 [Coniella lustricola]